MTGPTQPFPYDGLSVLSPKLSSSSTVRKQIGQGASGDLGIRIVGPNNGDLIDATSVKMTLYLDDDFDETNAFEDENPLGEQVATFNLIDGTVRHEERGVYSVEVSPAQTRERGNLAAVWEYVVNGVNVRYTDRVAIIEPMPTYDALRDYEKAIIEQVSWMFDDLFDSTNGGPNLTENFQTHFNYERMAQLMKVAMVRINTSGVPMMNFGLGEGSTRLPNEFHGFLLLGTYLETMLHFVRSYTEQPTFTNMAVTYTDRRDYAQRWKQVYDSEKADFDRNLKLAKRKWLGLGRGSLLVAGGIYGSGGGYFRSGLTAAHVRSMRFYPAAPAIYMAR